MVGLEGNDADLGAGRGDPGDEILSEEILIIADADCIGFDFGDNRIGTGDRVAEKGLVDEAGREHAQTATLLVVDGKPALLLDDVAVPSDRSDEPFPVFACLREKAHVAGMDHIESAEHEDGSHGLRVKKSQGLLKHSGPYGLSPGLCLGILEGMEVSRMAQADSDLVVVIMAGGAGTRFWPLSTQDRPKQFLRLFGERTLLQKSYDRIVGLVEPARVLVLTGLDFVGLVREQLPELPAENVIGEPYRRDTAAAVCLAALLVRKRFGNAVIATLTSDHLNEPIDHFRATLLSAARQASSDEVLYTFGVRPTFAATGYGYLEVGEVGTVDGVIRHYPLKRFKEKPDRTTAASYVESGRFLWNSGMFVWTADAIIHQLQAHLPDHVAALARAVDHDRLATWTTMLAESFLPLRAISIDFAVMEKAPNVRCVEATFSWSDVGGWLALAEHLPADTVGNRHRGRLVTLDAHGNLVFCERADDVVMLVGVDDLVVVHAGGRILVATKERTEEIKQLVKDFKLE